MAEPAMSPAPGVEADREEQQQECVARDGKELPRDAEGQYRLGVFYSDEEDHQDLELAVFWFGRAARQGHAQAMFMLGRMIEAGEGPVRDPGQAASWYRKAAGAGHSQAMKELASRPPEPPGLLDMAVAGDPRSQYQLGFSHFMGTGAPKDYAQSYFWFKVLGKTMPAQACQTLQMLEGRVNSLARAELDWLAGAWTPGSPPPVALAQRDLRRLRAAATFDDGPACYALGKALAATGTPDHKAEALEWFAWAGKQGNVPAHYALAFHYREVGDEDEVERHLYLAEGPPPSLEILDEGARCGINQCRYQLAMRLVTGQEAQPDPPRTAMLYRAAAEDGYIPAMVKVGACYFKGYGVERDLAQAGYWFAKGAEHEDAEALYGLGALHHNRALAAAREGEGAVGDPDAPMREHEQAAAFWERASAKGHAASLHSLALSYGLGEGVPRDLDRMRQLHWEAAANGHTESQYLVGNYYARGEGTFKQDDGKAVYWYASAARRRHPDATFRLAAHVLYGRGVEKDFQRGWELTGKAADLGSPEAMVALAAMIETGECPVSDPGVALDWYRKASEAGSAEARYRLGQKQMQSGGAAYALPFLEQAAAQGHEKAQALLRRIAEEAEAAPPQAQRPAAEWSNHPAAMAIAGDANAQFQIGFAYYSGIGVPRSFPLSYFWLKVVERSMPAAVVQMLQAVGAQFGEALRAELDRLAAAWTPGTAPPEG
jgi:hypothetical protein